MCSVVHGHCQRRTNYIECKVNIKLNLGDSECPSIKLYCKNWRLFKKECVALKVLCAYEVQMNM